MLMGVGMDRWEQEAERRAAAVARTEGLLLVAAGAGGGKTGVLVGRALRLIERGGVRPEQVWVVAFTGKAVGEFTGRLRQKLGDRTPRVSTVHRAARLVLREHASSWLAGQGLMPVFRIVSGAAALSHFTGALLAHRRATGEDDREEPPLLFERLQYERLCRADAAPRPDSPLRPVYDRYLARLRRENGVDLTELVSLAAALLEAEPAVRERVQVRYLLVDETQDLNPGQLRFLQLLVDPDQNLTFVGDARQSIFSWQGADPRLLEHLPHGEPPATTITLHANYRSTAAIIRAAETVLGKQAVHYSPQWPRRGEGDSVRIVPSSDSDVEARRVAQWLTRQHGDGVAWCEMAVLARTHARLAPIEETLLREGIPYQAARTSFFDRPGAREPMAFLRHLAGEPEALRDVLATGPWAIPPMELAGLDALGRARGLTLRHLLGKAATLPLPRLTRLRLATLARILTGLEQPRRGYDRQGATLLRTLQGVLRETGVEAWLALQPTGSRRDENPAHNLALLRELIIDHFSGADGLESLVRLARSVRAPDPLDVEAPLEVALDASAAPEDEALDATEPERGGVQLLTLHQSKGSEFDAVAIVGGEELDRRPKEWNFTAGERGNSIVPLGSRSASGEGTSDRYGFPQLAEADEWEQGRMGDFGEQMQEARRLLYVGMTRARDRLVLFRVGKRGRIPQILSGVETPERVGECRDQT